MTPLLTRLVTKSSPPEVEVPINLGDRPTNPSVEIPLISVAYDIDRNLAF